VQAYEQVPGLNSERRVAVPLQDYYPRISGPEGHFLSQLTVAVQSGGLDSCGKCSISLTDLFESGADSALILRKNDLDMCILDGLVPAMQYIIGP